MIWKKKPRKHNPSAPTGHAPYMRKKTKRDPMVVVITGEMGVGKSYRTMQEVHHYLKNNKQTGKKGRKVLAFDVNMDDYPSFRTVNPLYISRLRNIEPRRILPLTPEGKAMNNAEKKEIVNQIFENYENGMVILDDYDSYMKGSTKQSITSALTTVRHKDIDILFSHQSISKITTTEWEAVTWLRVHHQVDPVTRYKERIPNYAIVRIAQLIVNEQYDLSYNAFVSGKINEDQHKKYSSFFVYINMRKVYITACSRPAFIRAAKKYIDQEENGTIRLMLNERDFNGRKKYLNRNEAVLQLLLQFMRHHREE